MPCPLPRKTSWCWRVTILSWCRTPVRLHPFTFIQEQTSCIKLGEESVFIVWKARFGVSQRILHSCLEQAMISVWNIKLTRVLTLNRAYWDKLSWQKGLALGWSLWVLVLMTWLLVAVSMMCITSAGVKLVLATLYYFLLPYLLVNVKSFWTFLLHFTPCEINLYLGVGILTE